MYLGNTPTQQAFTPAVDVFSGNGSTTAFTLSRPVASVAQVQAFIENVPQSPVDAFTVSGNTLTFTSAPPSGSSNMYVRYTSPITQVIAPSDGSVGTSKLVDGAVTQAKLGANVAGTGPAFSAYAGSTTSVSNGVETKVLFDTEEFDTNSNFASSRFTPTVAGYYQLNGCVRIDSVTSTSYVYAILYKNGAAYKYGTILVSAASTFNYQCVVSSVGYANGSTDYYELYVYQTTGASKTTGTGIGNTYFNGNLVRAA